jgi:broad specificity phosphatase PhoE
MKLYFVRHGESKLNAVHTHQDRNTELSPKGIQQAKYVANRFRDTPIELIISSPHTRAQQTAEEISNVIHKQVFYTDTLGEWKKPTVIEGKKIDDPEVVLVKEALKRNARLQDWHFSDEENFYDFRERIRGFFEYITLFKEDTILAVTHSHVLRMIIGFILLGDMDHEAWHHVDSTLRTNNTGITLCEKDDTGKWQLITWNDHAHLG